MTSATTLLLVLWFTPTAAQPPADAARWLDRPLANWNKAGAGASVALPSPSAKVDQQAIRTRCQIPAASTAGQRALEQAGWIAYDHLDRALSQNDVEIVAGMTDADATCRPSGFQLFVFVGGAFAGTLSPEPMITAQDASAGAVRIVGADAITAEFARYGNKDTPCCPTSHMTVRYRIDRADARPVIVPVDIRTTRGH